jgi:tripeptide aminopeptidase
MLMSDERLLATFLDLVRIYSPSGLENDCAQYCADALRQAGCSVRFDGAAAITGSDVGNMIAELPGTAPGVIVLSAHFDVVEPCDGVEPVVEDGKVFSAGETVLGADDKAGLAAAIEGVRRLAEEGGTYPTVRCVFTVQEEVGLHGAKALNPQDVAADLCLVLDADGSPGGIVIAAPSHYTFKAEFHGRASHAGVAPEKGVSAIRMTSDAVSRMELGRLDDKTTANVGTISGGTATNVIAARTSLTGECRSLDKKRAEEVRDAMDTALREAADAFGGAVEVAWTLEYESFQLSEDHPVVSALELACRDIGVEPRTFSTGGGSDANIIAALGVPTVALSCGMSGVHGTDEQISIADLNALAALVVAAARRLVR